MLSVAKVSVVAPSSLLREFVNYGRKKYYDIGPRTLIGIRFITKVRAPLHYGENRANLVHFRGQKKNILHF